MFARPFPCTQLPTTTWAQLLSAVYIPRFSPPLHNRAVPRAVPSRRRSGGTRYSPTLEAEPCHQLGNAVRDVSVTCSGVVMQRHKSGSPSPLALLGPSPPPSQIHGFSCEASIARFGSGLARGKTHVLSEALRWLGSDAPVEKGRYCCQVAAAAAWVIRSTVPPWTRGPRHGPTRSPDGR